MFKKKRYIRCAECGCKIYEGEKRYIILGESNCVPCGLDWIKDEVAVRFEELADDCAELVGVQIEEDSW